MALALWISASGSALACKYSVRDVAFVDLGSALYKLHCFHDRSSPAEWLANLSQAAAVTFDEANVQLELVDLDKQPDHPARKYVAEHRLNRFPAALLVNGEGGSLPLSFAPNDGSLPTKAEIGALLEQAITSPARSSLLQQVVKAYAVVVLAEGKDAAQNERVRAAIREGFAEIGRLMPHMPKPVDTPPTTITITSAEKARESVLLWSLGIDHAESVEPQMVVVHGRGRRIGPALKGAVISPTALLDLLALIGQDCECNLDRSFMQGPLIPSRWGSELQQAALKNLGFDPENPMVRSEVSRILARGPNAKNNGGVARTPSSASTLALGYSEETIGGELEPPPTTELEDTPLTPSTLASTPAASSAPTNAAGKSAPNPPALAATSYYRPAWFSVIGIAIVMLVAGVGIWFWATAKDR